MITPERVKTITKEVLKEQQLYGFIKVFEKEHNLFRGSHDKIQLPAALNIPQQIITQIVEKFDTQLTEGSIPFIGEDRHFTEDNANLFWDQANLRLGLGTSEPGCALDIEFETVTSVVARISAKTKPWMHWECVDGNWGYAFGIEADDKKFHLHYDTPIGSAQQHLLCLDGDNVRVGILDDTPSYPLDVGGNTRVQGTFRATGAATLESTLAVTELVTASSGIAGPIQLIGYNGSGEFRFMGARASGSSGVTYQDSGGDARLMLLVKQNQDIVELLNRAANGTVEIHANTSTAGLGGDVKVAEFQDDRIIVYQDIYLDNTKELRFYDNGNYVGFEAPALAADQIWVLPSADGGAGEGLSTDGVGNLSWTSFPDEKVGVDSGAAAGYLGAAGDDGVLRVGAPLSYTDGGDFVTLGVDGTVLVDGDFASAGIMMTDGAGTYSILPGGEDAVTDHNLWIGTGAAANLAEGGQHNLFVGEQAGYSLTTGDQNIFLGEQAGYSLTGNSYNIFIGYRSGYGSTGGEYNTYIGTGAGYNNTTGDTNICFGNNAGYGAVGATFGGCVFIGTEAGYSNDAENNVIGIGYKAARGLISGMFPVCIGSSAGREITSGHYNLAIGADAMRYNQTGGYNVCVGMNAGRGKSGDSYSECVFFGANAGYYNESNKNIAIGGYASYYTTTGTANLAMGYQAGYCNVTGGYNVLLGYEAGMGEYTHGGSYNTFVGSGAGRWIKTGSNNVCIGYRNSHYLSVGSNNVCIGNRAGENNLAGDNQLWIANTASGIPLIYGEFDNARLNVHGALNVLDPTSLGAECLSETDFATHAKWDTTGDFDDTGGDAEYIHSGGAGTLTQTSANLATALVGNRYYLLTYTVSGYSNRNFITREITTGILDAALTIPITNGAHSVLLFTKATPGDFVISVTSDGTCDFTIDDISLKLISGHSPLRCGTVITDDELRFYDDGNYVGFKAPALAADQIWVLPDADGPANECLGTDGAGNLVWRTHDELAGFVAVEHIDWTNASDNFSTSGTLASGNLAVTGTATVSTIVFINETANTGMTQGITINMGAFENEAFAIKGTNVAHGMTDLAETDTMFAIEPLSDAWGGADFIGYSENNKDNTATAPVVVNSAKKDNSGVGAQGADANIFVLQTNGSTRHIFDEDGDYLYDGVAPANYDEYNDALACRDLSMVLSKRFNQVMTYSEEKLTAMGVLKPFVSTKALNMLELGAIAQLYERNKELEAKIEALEKRLEA